MRKEFIVINSQSQQLQVTGVALLRLDLLTDINAEWNDVYTEQDVMQKFEDFPQKHAVPRREISLLIHWLEAYADQDRFKLCEDEFQLQNTIKSLFMERLITGFDAKPDDKHWLRKVDEAGDSTFEIGREHHEAVIDELCVEPILDDAPIIKAAEQDSLQELPLLEQATRTNTEGINTDSSRKEIKQSLVKINDQTSKETNETSTASKDDDKLHDRKRKSREDGDSILRYFFYLEHRQYSQRNQDPDIRFGKYHRDFVACKLIPDFTIFSERKKLFNNSTIFSQIVHNFIPETEIERQRDKICKHCFHQAPKAVFTLTNNHLVVIKPSEHSELPEQQDNTKQLTIYQPHMRLYKNIHYIMFFGQFKKLGLMSSMALCQGEYYFVPPTITTLSETLNEQVVFNFAKQKK